MCGRNAGLIQSLDVWLFVQCHDSELELYELKDLVIASELSKKQD